MIGILDEWNDGLYNGSPFEGGLGDVITGYWVLVSGYWLLCNPYSTI